MQGQTLYDTMVQDAARECEAIRAQADAEAAAIEKEARDTAAALHETTWARVNAEKARLDQLARQRAEDEVQKFSLAMRHQVADEVLADVESAFKRIAAGADFPAVLEALLEEALDEAPADVVVRVPEAHVERCRDWLRKHGRAQADVQPSKALWDGVAVEDRAHTYRITNSLTMRFHKLEPVARKLSMERLFGEPSPAETAREEER